MMQHSDPEAIYEILSRAYPTYAESDDEWMTNGQDTIAVDTHVRRLVQRLGLVGSGLSSEATAQTLTEITPARYRRHAHEWLIQHGMKVCVARAPRCGDCALNDLCEDRRARAADPPS